MKNILLTSLLMGSATAIATADLQLADQGRSEYQIVLADGAIPSESYAAQELRRYLERVSGAHLQMAPRDDTVPRRALFVGDSPRLRQLLPDLDLQRVGPDGFVLRTHQNHLIIAGGKPRGTLNGVYTFLEEQLGVRWFTPELEIVPESQQVRLPDLDKTHVPALENRDVFWRETMRNPDFAARHRLNGQHYGLQERHGGAFTTYHPFVHSFDELVPRSLFKEHPEYFPLIQGERKDGYVQRCLTHPEVLELAIANVRRWIQDHPRATIISVSQNDTFNNCQCPRCKALDDAEGTPAGSLLQFVNGIAQALETESPHIRFDTLAYQYTRKPPRTLRPHRNVIVRLCSIECCFAHPLADCSAEANRRFREDIIAWEPVAPLLYVWDYTPNFAHYLQPFPNFDSLQANVRFFVGHGVKGLFEQGNYSSGGQGEMGPLRAYVLAKLLWNPDTDVKRHIDEFVQAYYGRAADQVKAFLELSHQQVRGKECHAYIYDRPTACYLNEAFLRESNRLFDLAEEHAESETVRFRLRVARLPIWYVQIAAGHVSGDARHELIRRFLAVARQAGVSNISEGSTLEQWAKKMGAE